MLYFHYRYTHFDANVKLCYFGTYLYSLIFLRSNTTKSERFYWIRIDWHEMLSHKMSVSLCTAANIDFSYDRIAQSVEYPTGRFISYRRPTLSHMRASRLPIIDCPYRTGPASRVLEWRQLLRQPRLTYFNFSPQILYLNIT